VVGKKKISEGSVSSVAELFNNTPGIDVAGVGGNQKRPIIRGLRGERILLLEDGIRMNNSRRNKDFGTITSTVGMEDIDRIEIVKGPASVLYGSDAIGGVFNMITATPNFDIKSNSMSGRLIYRYSNGDKGNNGAFTLKGNIGKIGASFTGNYKKLDDYKVPAGNFGNINLKDSIVVKDSGVEDYGGKLKLLYKFSNNSAFTFKYNYYRGDNSGFGYIDPKIYNSNDPSIRIKYPMQKYSNINFNYLNNRLNLLFADSLDISYYSRRNQRELSMGIAIPMSIRGRSVELNIDSLNYTDIKTRGLRVEINKNISNHIFTYGIDYFKDYSDNTDSRSTIMNGFGPSMAQIDTTPQLPKAEYASFGIFIQDEVTPFENFSLVAGLRFQKVKGETFETPGLEEVKKEISKNNTFVGTLGLIYKFTPQFRTYFSVGRGFRAPNLIENFFNGATPEGRGFQKRNTNLKAETSLNFDIGVRYNSGRVYFDGCYFNNKLYDGIRIEETGNRVNGLSEYQNINVDKLKIEGFEFSLNINPVKNINFLSNFTKIKSVDIGNKEKPYSDTYGSKFVVGFRYEETKGTWFEYNIRISGRSKDVVLADNPIGEYIPGFTVHNSGFGVELFKGKKYSQKLIFRLNNITNKLYSEFSNGSFFRPSKGRNFVISWIGEF
jgi:outer membrane receptor protein involved in Fe transport